MREFVILGGLVLGVVVGHAAAQRTLGPILLVDAGHGGRDPGAVAGGVRESDIVLTAALEVGAAWPGRVRYTRTTPAEQPTINRRAALARDPAVALTISIHMNASRDPAHHGGEVWTNLAGMPYAEAIAAAWRGGEGLAGTHPPRWRRIEPASRWVDSRTGLPGLWIEATPRPAVLLELAFISNPADRAWALDDARRGRLLNLVTRALYTTWQATPAA